MEFKSKDVYFHGRLRDRFLTSVVPLTTLGWQLNRVALGSMAKWLELSALLCLSDKKPFKNELEPIPCCYVTARISMYVLLKTKEAVKSLRFTNNVPSMLLQQDWSKL